MANLTLNQYQEQAMTTCTKTSMNPLYMLFMLGEEIGELQGKFSKAIRKGWLLFVNNEIYVDYDCVTEAEYDEWYDLIKKELGDIQWGVAGFAHVMHWPLNDVGQGNLDKLAARKKAGTIVGNGDGIIRDK